MNFEIKSHKNISVEDYVISENNHDCFDYEGGDFSGTKDFRFKAVLKNISNKKLTDVKYDLRFYDKNKKLLNIVKSKFIDEDEIIRDEELVVYLSYNIPSSCKEVIFSSRAIREFKIFKFFCISTFVLYILLLIAGEVVHLFYKQ